jgi:hypothetical protein
MLFNTAARPATDSPEPSAAEPPAALDSAAVIEGWFAIWPTTSLCNCIGTKMTFELPDLAICCTAEWFNSKGLGNEKQNTHELPIDEFAWQRG